MTFDSTNRIVQVSPSGEIVFKGPFLNSVVSSKLTIRNLTDKTVAFKIKTTAPRRYCVRPNSGTLMPTESLEIYVMLQPCNESLDGAKHKFMVQSMIVPDDQSYTQDVWKSASKEEIFETKLKCSFENLDGYEPMSQSAVSSTTNSTAMGMASPQQAAAQPSEKAGEAASGDGEARAESTKPPPSAGADDARTSELMQEVALLKSENKRLKALMKQSLNTPPPAMDQPSAETKKVVTPAFVAVALLGFLLGLAMNFFVSR